MTKSKMDQKLNAPRTKSTFLDDNHKKFLLTLDKKPMTCPRCILIYLFKKSLKPKIANIPFSRCKYITNLTITLKRLEDSEGAL